MKKFIYGALALASVASLASCSSDEPFGQQPNDGKVTFTVTMPGQNTRFAEGTTVDQLYYTVFQNGTKVLEGVEDWPTGSLSTTVTLQLVSNQSYDVVFFADTKAAETAGVYTYKPATADFTVTYSDKMINNDAYDAFVKKEAIVADGGEKKVLLYRPFAQVNIGSDDLGTDAVTTYGLGNFSSTLTIQPTNLLSGMNFLSGTTTPQAAAVTFSLENFSNLPGDKFPVDGTPEKPYKYIEMNYLLVPAAPETAAEDWSNLLDVTYTINGKSNVVNELNLSSMPTRQNYQTNVYGSLLTTQQKFDVSIVPAFDGNFDRVVIDGISYKQVATPTEFTAALEAGEPVYVAKGTTIDLTDWNPTLTTGRGYVCTNPVNIRIDGEVANLHVPVTFNEAANISGTGTLKLSPNTASYNNYLLSFSGNNSKVEGITIDGTGNQNMNVAALIDIYSECSWNNVTLKGATSLLASTSVNTQFDNCVFEMSDSKRDSSGALMFERDFNCTFNNCIIVSDDVAIYIDNTKGYGKASANFKGGYILKTSSNEGENLDVAVFSSVVSVTFTGTSIYNISESGYSIAVCPLSEIETPDNMILNLSDVALNRKIMEVNLEATSPDEMLAPLEAPYFTYADKSSSFKFGNVTYNFPWLVSGKYEKLKN